MGRLRWSILIKTLLELGVHHCQTNHDDALRGLDCWWVRSSGFTKLQVCCFCGSHQVYLPIWFVWLKTVAYWHELWDGSITKTSNCVGPWAPHGVWAIPPNVSIRLSGYFMDISWIFDGYFMDISPELMKFSQIQRTRRRQQTLTEDGRYDIRLYDPHSEAHGSLEKNHGPFVVTPK